MIVFIVVTSDLRLYVLDTWVKREAEASTVHHLMASWIRGQGREGCQTDPENPNE